MHPGQLLFLPSGSMVSWHAVAPAPNGTLVLLQHLGEEASKAQRAIVLEHCYVDASNLNRVVSWLATSGLVKPADVDLLHLLQSPLLDVNLARLPTVRWGQGPVCLPPPPVRCGCTPRHLSASVMCRGLWLRLAWACRWAWGKGDGHVLPLRAGATPPCGLGVRVCLCSRCLFKSTCLGRGMRRRREREREREQEQEQEHGGLATAPAA